MTIEYRSKPGPIANFINRHSIRFVGWDLDGTIANTERLHRAICRSVLQELSNTIISDREFRSPGYRAAFGLPGAETSRHLAKILRETNPEGFQSALKSALAKGLVGDSLDTVGAAITQLRQETFAFYLQMSSLKSSGCSSDVRTLVVNSPSQTQAVQTARRLDVLKDVKVPTYPHVVPLLKMFSEHNIRQGIATSSGAFFAQGLLKALQLDNYFNAIVSADCVPQGHHKPEARPWQLLHERLTGSTITTAKGTPLSDMLFIENSAGGGLSSLRAGYGPVFIVADNIPATVGKLQAKIQAYQGDSERRIHGQAIFIDHLGSLLCPKTV